MLVSAGAGKNLLLSLDQLGAMLRTLPVLRCLTVEHNPLCQAGEDGSYRAWLCARLPRLLYLDHRRVGAEEVQAAQELYQVGG